MTVRQLFDPATQPVHATQPVPIMTQDQALERMDAYYQNLRGPCSSGMRKDREALRIVLEMARGGS